MQYVVFETVRIQLSLSLLYLVFFEDINVLDPSYKFKHCLAIFL